MLFLMIQSPKSPNAPRTFGYCRVSTDDQVRGESLEAQRRQIEAICTLEGLALAEIFIEEGVSGSIPLAARPEGARLLAAAKRRGDVIIGVKLDRVFRDTADALNTVAALKSRRVKFYLHDMRGYIAGDAEGELRLTVLAGVAQFERRRIGERVRDARRSLKARGIYAGGDTPFGFDKAVDEAGGMTRLGKARQRLVPNEAIHAAARDLLAKGYSSRLAAGYFAAHGYDVSHIAVIGLFRYLRSRLAA
jgi:putative DNA-invertase from lambdoid prophage Rac